MINVINVTYKNGNSVRVEYKEMKELNKEIKTITKKEWKEIEKISFYRYENGVTNVVASISVYE
jgi:hypothetical protein